MTRPLNPIVATLAAVLTLAVISAIMLIGLLLPFGDSCARRFLWCHGYLRRLPQ